MINFAPGDQLPLRFKINEIADFEHFLPGVNSEVCDCCKQIAAGHKSGNIYIWGKPNSGKSHILQAVCHLAARKHQRTVSYIPLQQHAQFKPEILDGMENLDLVCIDDIYLIAGHIAWEKALFDFYNRMYERQKSLLISGNCNPRILDIALPDLKSRIGWGLSYHLKILGDEDKILLLQQRAQSRAFELPQGVADYMIRHVERDLSTLLDLLDKLDTATLTAQRKLSIPFLNTLLRKK